MSEVFLARSQFAITSTYHFFFVPLTLGLALLVAILQTIYYKTGDETYKKMTKFWGKLFLINFAMGVVTGIVMEFQFGMNWSEYSRFMGDIFGAPLALEALIAFFIESVFIGVWVFGWDKLSKGVHLVCIWLVALASNFSAIWILIANSFMQHPVGYALAEDGSRVEMTDFGAVIMNPYVMGQFPHVLFAGITTAGFFVLGISAWHLLRRKGQNTEFFKKSFRIALLWSLLGSVCVAGIGHMVAMRMFELQPMKMAAAEAMWEAPDDSASLSLFTLADEEAQTNPVDIKVPGLLSFLMMGATDGIKGMKDINLEMIDKHGPGNYIPPVNITFWSFRVMVGLGTVMILLAFLGLLFWNKFAEKKLFLALLIPAIALPYIANSTGWFLAEFGRQPWIVYGLQKVEDGVSKAVTAPEIITSIILFTLIYGLLMAADIFLLAKSAKEGPEAPESDNNTEKA